MVERHSLAAGNRLDGGPRRKSLSCIHGAGGALSGGVPRLGSERLTGRRLV